MIEDNYSKLNYIREPQVINRYQSANRKRRITHKLLIAGLVLFITSGSVVAYELGSEKVANKAVFVQTIKDSGQGSDEADTQDAVDNTAQLAVAHSNYNLAQSPSVLNGKVGADAYLVGDVETGEIILAKNETKQYPIASVTKLMTALVARQSVDLHQQATITRQAIATYGTEGELVLGQKMFLSDLIYPMLLESSNDAAEFFAEQLSNNGFIDNMNKKAAEVGMKQTHYEDSSGLTPHNISTATDLFKLGSYIYAHDRGIFDITRIKQYAILGHQWTNHNHFLGYDNFVGGKNGYTDEARRTSVALYSYPGANNKNRIVEVVLLKSENRERDMGAIVNFLNKNLSYIGQ